MNPSPQGARVGRIYADNNATTRPDPRVTEAMQPFLGELFGNPSSVHQPGRNARAALDEARATLCGVLGVEPAEVVFTSSGSEANALGILGTANVPAPEASRRIVASQIEHPSILETLKICKQQGYEVQWVGPSSEGRVNPDEFIAALKPGTALACLMLANNETGVLQPVAEVGAACAEQGIPFLVDAVQAFGKVPVRPKEIPCDLCALSAHKIHGPKGAGALYVRRGLSLRPLIAGHQERGRRAGTENVAAHVGFGIAARIACEVQSETSERVRGLRDRLENGVLSSLTGAIAHGRSAPRVGNTSSFGFPGVDGEALLIALDLEGIAASTGAACSSGSLAPSHVLIAMGLTPAQAQGSLRVSLSRETTESEVDSLADALVRLVPRARTG